MLPLKFAKMAKENSLDKLADIWVDMLDILQKIQLEKNSSRICGIVI